MILFTKQMMSTLLQEKQGCKSQKTTFSYFPKKGFHMHTFKVCVSPLLTLPLSSIRVFVGIVLHPHGGVCRTSCLLVGGAARSWASLDVESWIAAFRERVLDAHSSHVPEHQPQQKH